MRAEKVSRREARMKSTRVLAAIMNQTQREMRFFVGIHYPDLVLNI